MPPDEAQKLEHLKTLAGLLRGNARERRKLTDHILALDKEKGRLEEEVRLAGFVASLKSHTADQFADEIEAFLKEKGGAP